MKFTREFLLIDGREHEVTHIMESKFSVTEVVWWLIQIGRWYKAETMLLVEMEFYQGCPIPMGSKIIRRFELKQQEKASV